MVVMSGWGGLGGYLEDLGQRREEAGDSTNTSPGANFTRRACDAAARTGLPPALAPHVHYTCGPYWEDAPYEPPTDPRPPLEGGQCPGVPYDLFRIRQPTPDTQVEDEILAAANLFGPLNVTNITKGVELDEETGLSIYTYDVIRAGVLFTSTQTSSVGPPTFRAERVDGLPDECGDPEPPLRDPIDIPPSLLPPFGEPVDISDPNDPGDDTPPIVFAPNPPPEYEPFVPFVPSFPGQPPFAFPPGPGDDIPPRVGPESDLPPGGSGSEDVEAPDDEDLPDECIGYAWEFYDIPANRGGIPGADPARFYEIFGSAQLRVSSRDVAIYDVPVKIDSARGVCYRSDKNLRVRGLSLNSKTSFGPVRVRPVYVVVREG